jgi:glutathione synthase/RimK-type ligase-like ATP-grasp enzyme
MTDNKSQSNTHNSVVKIIKEVCDEQNISYTSFSYDWIFKLCKGDKTAFIMGYDFGINTSVSSKLCDDKSAASDILINAGVKAVEHMFFMSPSNVHYIGENGNWLRLTALLEKHGKLVCKNNTGSGGNGVFLVRNQFELESSVHNLFKTSRSISVSPYYDIVTEYRVVILGGEVKLVYAKNIPCVIGDGKSTFRMLLSQNDYVADSDYYTADDLSSVLPDGEKRRISWKFNLGKGAVPEILTKDTPKKAELSRLAQSAAEALSVCFASVDIIETTDDNELRVLEVNSGTMMKNFADSTPDNYAIAKDIYTQAILMVIEA